ncbi:hypothetical protein PspLS_10294 [Pyricularia sp. CBS 133598]|nr:hypothetical protein PspLS_10294 [Pyricularia sp. CBS 133598]
MRFETLIALAAATLVAVFPAGGAAVPRPRYRIPDCTINIFDKSGRHVYTWKNWRGRSSVLGTINKKRYLVNLELDCSADDKNLPPGFSAKGFLTPGGVAPETKEILPSGAVRTARTKQKGVAASASRKKTTTTTTNAAV